MSGTPLSTPREAAGAALGALERYELHLRQLVTRWLDAELYHTVSLDMQDVRRCCRALPALSGPWVALLIAHAELVQALWRSTQAGSAIPPEQRERLLQRTGECVRLLQQRCMELAQPPGG